MNLTLEQFNKSEKDSLTDPLMKCCASTNWVKAMIDARPFTSMQMLLGKADYIWKQLNPEDWKEAFKSHPQIGDLNSLRKKFANSADWAQDEQKGTATADDNLLLELAHYNQQYLERFGFIFIIYATGKSAAEMLMELKRRLANTLKEELKNAAQEQSKITQLRLKKLFT